MYNRIRYFCTTRSSAKRPIKWKYPVAISTRQMSKNWYPWLFAKQIPELTTAGVIRGLHMWYVHARLCPRPQLGFTLSFPFAVSIIYDILHSLLLERTMLITKLLRLRRTFGIFHLRCFISKPLTMRSKINHGMHDFGHAMHCVNIGIIVYYRLLPT